MKVKKNLVFLFFIIAGIIIGSLVASLTDSAPFLSWLSYGKTIGISADNPFILDLAVVKIAFGIEMGINISQIIFIVLSIFAYKETVKKL